MDNLFVDLVYQNVWALSYEAYLILTPTYYITQNHKITHSTPASPWITERRKSVTTKDDTTIEDINQTEQTEQTEQDHRHSSCLPRERSGAYEEDSRLKSNEIEDEIEDSNINLPTRTKGTQTTVEQLGL